MKLLAISGSLRSISKNTTLIKAAILLAPAGVDLTLYPDLGAIPPFNPDLDELDRGVAPAPVLAFRDALRAAEGLFFCSPEYAHGVSGVLKNALDWLVGSGELVGKPLLVFNAAPSSFHAHRALVETLRTMDARVLEAALPGAPSGSRLLKEDVVKHPAMAGALREAITALVTAVDHPAEG
jgi:chromate reductase, NAD(P)H dehydrogenase (quinone)